MPCTARWARLGAQKRFLGRLFGEASLSIGIRGLFSLVPRQPKNNNTAFPGAAERNLGE